MVLVYSLWFSDKFSSSCLPCFRRLSLSLSLSLTLTLSLCPSLSMLFLLVEKYIKIEQQRIF